MTSHVNSAVFTQNLAATCAGYPTQTDIKISVGFALLVLATFLAAWLHGKQKLSWELVTLAMTLSVMVGIGVTFVPFIKIYC